MAARPASSHSTFKEIGQPASQGFHRSTYCSYYSPTDAQADRCECYCCHEVPIRFGVVVVACFSISPIRIPHSLTHGVCHRLLLIIATLRQLPADCC
jgi:hypothetical protein